MGTFVTKSDLGIGTIVGRYNITSFHIYCPFIQQFINLFRSSDTLILMLMWFGFSAVFNIFGVISVCGLFAGKKINLEWYPITRDCVVYGITVLLLIIVLLDEKVRNETFETLKFFN